MKCRNLMREYRGIGTPPKKSPYQKSKAILELEKLANEQARRDHPGMDPRYLAPRKFTDDNSNGLTIAIVTYIKLMGGLASRLNNQGTYIKKLNRYIPSTSRRGLPDILGTYHGDSLFVEVKIGKDRQSEHQMKVETEQRNAGGLYFIAKDFEGFYNWFKTL